ncbi:hypothetical protein BGX21_006288 [Mortierella sp. AD011]|nr:hypothetical protein BGX20_006382 [Mortierella sp. AD010]KAF9368871.1 hypothetical protein BGX21_006288 [Mortierella sp. AD011]
MSAIADEYSLLLKTQWGFLHEEWPAVDKAKFHRTEIKEVSEIAHVKSTVLDKLGFIPTFFFLAHIFGTRMTRFIPKTSYYGLHREFYLHEPDNLHYDITSRMLQMCSSLRIRLLLAKNNPEPFKHVTLNLGGHDTRVSHIAADKPSLYSHKLKKSGFRVQVCTDMNNIVLFASKPAPCRDYNDGAMLVKMNIASRIQKLDCIALDGGYNGFVSQVVDSSDILSHENFSCPVRKTKGIAFLWKKRTDFVKEQCDAPLVIIQLKSM